MMIALHKQARTTPAVRAEIAASRQSVAAPAKRYGISEATVRKWKSRTDFMDRPHTAHRLQTTLTPEQEVVVVALRKTLLLPLDDLLAVTREFLNPNVSRSGLVRCLRRHGVGNLRNLRPKPEKSAHKPFKAYEPGYLHIDVKYLPQLADEDRRRYLFVAIDRATRSVFIDTKANKSAASARAFLKALHKACPIRITKILTDNGKGSRTACLLPMTANPPGIMSSTSCATHRAEHRLTKPRSPQTNGMVERFNSRISDILATHHFDSSQELEQTLRRYVYLYNHQLPQSALGSQTPLLAMRKWYQSHPHLFVRGPYDHAGLDIYF